MRSLPKSLLSATLLALVPSVAWAAPAASADANVGVSTDATTTAREDDEVKWINRWPPTRNMIEVGIFGGVAFPSSRLELFEPDLMLPDQGFKALRTVAPDIGGRVAFFPLRFLGAEIEGAVIPSKTEADSEGALLWAFRGHVIAQLPKWSVTPFVLAGPSVLGVVSERSALGNDVDLGVHFGAGVKAYLNRYVALRFDVRDTLTAKRGVSDGVGHTVELLAGISVTLNRKSKPKAPRDRDKDGILDDDDRCIDVPGIPENQGCPLNDRDGDGILDDDDECPDTPGVEEFNGCPVPDTDGDGILDPDDQCIEEPETANDYKDADGCPDEVPTELEEFTGVIEGISFDTNKDTIKSSSRKDLDHAVEILTQYPDIELGISGHTDDRGSDEYNMDLSTRRANAVRDYLVDHGIDASRITARGVGEASPRATNDTKSGRALNRRIEFTLNSD